MSLRLIISLKYRNCGKKGMFIFTIHKLSTKNLDENKCSAAIAACKTKRRFIVDRSFSLRLCILG